MKLVYNIILISIGLLSIENTEAQIFEKVKKAAKETVEDESVKETKKSTKDAMKSIFGKKKKKKGKNDSNDSESEDKSTQDSTSQESEIVSGSQFFPDGDVLFYERFEKDKLGDFPINWLTDVGGEIISVNDGKAFFIYNDAQVLLDIDPLPENFVVEFDLITQNLEGYGDHILIQLLSEKKLNTNRLDKTSSGASIELPTNGVRKGRNSKINYKNWGNENSQINNSTSLDFNEFLERSTHITIVKNGNRLRFYIDNQKVFDLPSFLDDEAGKYLRFNRDNLRDDKSGEITAIANVKITQEAQDIRSQLLKGNLSTNKILFETASSIIEAESEDVLNTIGEVLETNEDMQYLVIGHTDSEGSKDKNQTLSKERAEAVIEYLTANHDIDVNQLIPVGKGESEPVASNTTEDGKQQNRRVQFKKL